jgi:hypothetical protein
MLKLCTEDIPSSPKFDLQYRINQSQKEGSQRNKWFRFAAFLFYSKSPGNFNSFFKFCDMGFQFDFFS